MTDLRRASTRSPSQSRRRSFLRLRRRDDLGLDTRPGLGHGPDLDLELAPHTNGPVPGATPGATARPGRRPRATTPTLSDRTHVPAGPPFHVKRPDRRPRGTKAEPTGRRFTTRACKSSCIHRPRADGCRHRRRSPPGRGVATATRVLADGGPARYPEATARWSWPTAPTTTPCSATRRHTSAPAGRLPVAMPGPTAPQRRPPAADSTRSGRG
jgi:hypothetical protein